MGHASLFARFQVVALTARERGLLHDGSKMLAKLLSRQLTHED